MVRTILKVVHFFSLHWILFYLKIRESGAGTLPSSHIFSHRAYLVVIFSQYLRNEGFYSIDAISSRFTPTRYILYLLHYVTMLLKVMKLLKDDLK